MFRNFCTVLIFLFAFFALNGATTSTKGTKVKPIGGCATTTSAKKDTSKVEPEIKCIPEEKRRQGQINWCKWYKRTFKGKLCKLDLDCLKVKSQRTEEENKRLETENQKQAICAHFSYKHIAKSNTYLLKEPKEGSLQVVKIKKGAELSFMQRVEGNQSWMLVADKGCDQGYINEKFVRGRDDVVQETTEVVTVSKNEVIRLISPKWAKKNKLIIVPSSGFFDIEGAVSKSVDQITLNDEDLIIENDRSFGETLLIKNEDLDIRIVAYKDGEQLGKLIFKITTNN